MDPHSYHTQLPNDPGVSLLTLNPLVFGSPRYWSHHCFSLPVQGTAPLSFPEGLSLFSLSSLMSLVKIWLTHHPTPCHALAWHSLQSTFTSIDLLILSRVREEDRGAGVALSTQRISKPKPKMLRNLAKVSGLVPGPGSSAGLLPVLWVVSPQSEVALVTVFIGSLPHPPRITQTRVFSTNVCSLWPSSTCLHLADGIRSPTSMLCEDIHSHML